MDSTTQPAAKKSKRTSQSFALGAMIMAVGMIIVKIAGAAFKVPLAYILGGVGSGYFNIAYNLYNPLYALATAGLPIAISRMVAKDVANNRFKDVKMIHKISVPIFVTTGLIGMLLMFLGAQACVNFTNSPGALYSIIVLAPTVFFSCLISIYKGYYEGLRNMIPTAVSEIVEAIGKVVFGLGFASAAVDCGMNEYYNYGTVFGKYCENEIIAQGATLPFASAGAVLGITLGSISGFLYIFIKYKISGDGITEHEIQNSVEARPRKTLIKMLLNIAVPVALGAIIMQLAGAIDALLVLRRLNDIMQTCPKLLIDAYDGIIPAEVIADGKIHNFLAGCLAYMNTVTMLLPTLTQSISISALPTITAAWVGGVKENIKKNIETVMKITAMIAFPAGIGLSVLSHPIMNLIYNTLGKNTQQGEIYISAEIMTLYAIGIIFSAMSTPICGMLQAVGKPNYPVIILTIGMIIKIVLNYILVGIPQINIQGAGIGTLVCYLFICVAGIYLLERITKCRFNIKSVFIKPLICSILCGAGAYAGYGLFSRFINSKIATLIAIVIAVLVYVISIFATRTVNSDDLKSIPKCKKIVKVLEKWHLVG